MSKLSMHEKFEIIIRTSLDDQIANDVMNRVCVFTPLENGGFIAGSHIENVRDLYNTECIIAKLRDVMLTPYLHLVNKRYKYYTLRFIDNTAVNEFHERLTIHDYQMILNMYEVLVEQYNELEED